MERVKCEVCNAPTTALREGGRVVANVCPRCKVKRYTQAGMAHAPKCPACGRVPLWVENGADGLLIFIHSRGPEGSKGCTVYGSGFS